MKTAIVTGAARGIGYSIAKKLLMEGYRTVVFDLIPFDSIKDEFAELQKIGEAIYVEGNLTKAEDRARCVETAGEISLLVNNAGVAPRTRTDMLEMSEESYNFVMDINLKGSFFMTQAAANAMVAADKGGVIVNISSMSAYTSSTARAEYCLSKAGVSMSTILFADRLAEHGIGVYEVRPGIIKTPMTEVVTGKYDKLIYEDGVLPIKRWGQPEDIANAVAGLASGAFAYSTGEVINVDGGFHLRRL